MDAEVEPDPSPIVPPGAVTDPNKDTLKDAQATLASVIMERRRLAEQFAKLNLDTDRAKPSHHPLIQALLNARDDWRDCEKVRDRVGAYRNVTDMLRVIQKDISEGASEVNRLLIAVHQANVAKETRILNLRACDRSKPVSGNSLSTAEMLRVKDMLNAEKAADGG